MVFLCFVTPAVAPCQVEDPAVSRQDENPVSRAATIKAPIAESAFTEVMVLGTPHLSALGDEFKPSALERLLDTLERFGPDLIGVESLPPSVVLYMQQRPDSYSVALEYFAGNIAKYGEAARQALGVTFSEARRNVDALLAEFGGKSPEDIDPALQLRLLMQMLAAGDLNSALLQWSYLDKAAVAGIADLPEEIARFLDSALENMNNEIVSIGITLARRVGLQRIYPIDDHLDSDIAVDYIFETLRAELKGNGLAKSAPWKALADDLSTRLREGCLKGDLMPCYLYVNSAEYALADIDSQWNLYFRTNLPSGYDRARVAQWEIRNLNIASHIRRATALHPGKKVLVIIGSAHKPFLERYLEQMLDVRIVQLGQLAGGD